jgi:hypothetical protein
MEGIAVNLDLVRAGRAARVLPCVTLTKGGERRWQQHNEVAAVSAKELGQQLGLQSMATPSRLYFDIHDVTEEINVARVSDELAMALK